MVQVVLLNGIGFVSIICLFHPSHVTPTHALVVNDWFWIILSNNHAAILLNLQRCFPWLVNKPFRIVLELWQPLAYVISIGIGLLSKGNGTIASKVLIEMGSAR